MTHSSKVSGLWLPTSIERLEEGLMVESDILIRESPDAGCRTLPLTCWNRMTKQHAKHVDDHNDIDLQRVEDTHNTMSLLRPSIAGRLLRATGPASRRSAPIFVRYDSQTTSGTPLTGSNKSQPAYQTGESSMVNHPESASSEVRHNQPDYNAEVDQASSSVTIQ
jgi:hypothetical protein